MKSPGADLGEIVTGLRNGVNQGHSISSLLRLCVEQHDLHPLDVLKSLRLAFGLSLAQAAPVGGWRPDGSGEITHERLDQFINEAILAVRNSKNDSDSP